MSSTTPVVLDDLRVEHEKSPLGIDVPRPRLSWKLRGGPRATRQSAYQIIVATSLSDLRQRTRLSWDSGRVSSDQSIGVLYDGEPLRSRAAYFWTVRVWTATNALSEWAEPGEWEVGLLEPSDWTAQWVEPSQRPVQPEIHITPDQILDGTVSLEPDLSLLNPAQLVRRDFQLSAGIERARVRATAHGVYELQLNGTRVGDHELAPEYTTADAFLMYQTYDVTELVQPGSNAIGVTLADGWYAGRLGITGASANWGDRLGLLLQIEVTYTDGTTQTVGTDSTFRSSSGAVVYADLLVGQRTDARLEPVGWTLPGFDDSDWNPVQPVDHDLANLAAQVGTPLRAVAELPALEVITTPAGERVLDFGQNIAGHIRMNVQGTAGTEVILDHSQTLDEQGNFFANVLGRNNSSRDVYVLAGGPVETFEPSLTYHGFRYVRVSGYPGRLRPEQFTAVVVSSVSDSSIDFTTGDEDINQLHRNVQWTLRSNLLSVLTDNPDRERAGWTGDLQIVLPTAIQAFELESFLTRWFRNMVLEQLDDGQIPMVVPYFRAYREALSGDNEHSYAGWGDVAVLAPWTTYLAYGDRRVLEDTYAAAKGWVEYITRIAPGTLTEEDRTDPDKARLWRATAFHFGDWLTPSSTEVTELGLYSASNNFANVELLPTMYFAYSCDVLARIAVVLGEWIDAARYAEQAAQIRAGFVKAFVTDDGRLTRDTQGMYTLALALELVDQDLRPSFVRRLVELIHENGDRLDTGFLSTAHLLPVLSEEGYTRLAYDLLLQTAAPSWLYQVRQGATTIWEHWTAIEETGRVTRISQNQPGLSTVGAFLYGYVSGIRSDSPGYKTALIAPRVDDRLRFASARFESPHGRIATRWELTVDGLQLDVEIPPNTSAKLRMPERLIDVVERGVPAANVDGVLAAYQDGETLVLELGSGSYSFSGARAIAPSTPDGRDALVSPTSPSSPE